MDELERFARSRTLNVVVGVVFVVTNAIGWLLGGVGLFRNGAGRSQR